MRTVTLSVEPRFMIASSQSSFDNSLAGGRIFESHRRRRAIRYIFHNTVTMGMVMAIMLANYGVDNSGDDMVIDNDDDGGDGDDDMICGNNGAMGMGMAEDGHDDGDGDGIKRSPPASSILFFSSGL